MDWPLDATACIANAVLYVPVCAVSKTKPTSNTAALCYRAVRHTFMCRFVGRRYWPNVITSTPVFARSLIVCRISAAAHSGRMGWEHYGQRSVYSQCALCSERNGSCTVADSIDPDRTAALRHCGTAATRHCGAAATRRCGYAALRRCGAAALRRCGYAVIGSNRSGGQSRGDRTVYTHTCSRSY